MEFLVALCIAGGIGGGLYIPYLKYRRYRTVIDNISVKNDLEVMEVPIDELFAICSNSFDTHQWTFRYNISKVTLLASGYEKTKNQLSYDRRLVLIKNTLLVVSLDDFEKLCEWHDEWVKDGLLATWHARYKENKQ